MMFKQVLFFEEDADMGAILVDQARGEGLEIRLTQSARETLLALEQSSIDLLITDSRIPESNLSDFLGAILRGGKIKQIPKILVLTDQPQNIEGPIEYLKKPFGRLVLEQKIRSMLQQNQIKPGQLSLGDLVVDTRSFDVFLFNERIHLTPNEFKLLQVLMSHAGEVLSREQLIAMVQGEGIAVIDRAIDTHVFSLRKKLGAYGACVETVRGSGYRISTPMTQK